MGKKLYITTAIPYANAKPHIGNALDYLLADIWTRYQRQNGKEVRFQVGTDEHGNKIAAKAKEAGQEPQVFVDGMVPHFKSMMEKVGADYTDFVRTTDGHHIGAVQYIWKQLEPYIYKGTYEGWYCNGCENFVTDKEATANNGICPDHQTPYQRLSEENYYLKMSEFSGKIREQIESGRMRILPRYRRDEFLNLIHDTMPDVSISRPRKSLSWGVSVPGDDSQVMYVWIDALSNYLTVLGYPDVQGWEEYWPANVQVVGKDIMRFHAGTWPAMLLGLGLSLPKTLLVHGHVNVAGAKMSKSVGNVVDPTQLIDEYGQDAFRYYFSRHIPTQDDGDFTWDKFENAYNNELGNDLGNLVQRVAGMLTRYQSGVIGDAPQAEHDMGPYHSYMESLEFNKAIDEVWNMIRGLNQYIDRVKPWEVAKKRDTDTEATEHLEEILAHCAGVLLQVADMLVPFLPTTAESIKKTFAEGYVPSALDPLFPKLYIHTTDPRTPKPVAPVATTDAKPTETPAAPDKSDK